MGKGNIPPDIPGFSIPFQPGEAVLNGTIDYSNIQDALDQAVDGDVIQVGNGEYNENLLVENDYLTIQSAGAKVIGGDSYCIKLLNTTGVTVEGFQVENNTGANNEATVVSEGSSDHIFNRMNVLNSGGEAYKDIAGAQYTGTLTNWNVERCEGTMLVVRGNWYYIAGVNGGFVGSTTLGANGIQVYGDNNLIGGCSVSRCNNDGLQVIGDGNQFWPNFIRQAGNQGIYVTGDDAHFVGGVVSGSTGDDIAIGGAANRPAFWGTDYSTISDLGTETMANGRYVTPATIDLGGTGVETEIAPTDNGLSQYVLDVDAGGVATAIIGVDNIADVGTTVVLRRVGGENVTIGHQGPATNPMANLSGVTDTLNSVGDCVAYQYTGNQWNQLWVDL